MDDHPTDDTLSAYGLGKLDEQSSEAVHNHLESCRDCRKRVATMSSDSFLDRVRGVQQSPSLSEFNKSASGPQGAKYSPPPTETLPPGLADNPDYEIRKELGRGGMGVVYLAHNKLMGRDEVLKVMGRHLMERPGVADRFLREIRSVAKLKHPNIVTAYSALRLDDGIVFCMEYVEGLDLMKLVKAKGPLPVAHACRFIQQAAAGLQHAHKQGLVHRDIKPGNLMLAKEENKPVVKVLDFGLAKAAQREPTDGHETSVGQALGTPDYIAPEQILNAKEADIRADIYSLGGTLYYLLTGRPPFRANSLYDMYQAHISRDADPLNALRSDIPADLAALVAKMMAKEPGRRFQTPQEVADALAPFAKASGPASKVPGVADSQTGVTGVKPEAFSRTLPHSRPSPSEPDAIPLADTYAVVAPPKRVPDFSQPPSRPVSLPQTEPEPEDEPEEESEPRAWVGWIWAGLATAVGLGILGFFAMLFSGKVKVATPDGTIVVNNVPKDAEVFIDGTRITLTWPGQDKPLQITQVPGQHKVEVKQDGFKTYGEVVTVEPDGKEEITVRLEPVFASVLLKNLPYDVEVFVDGTRTEFERPELGQPVRLRQLPGQHTIQVKKDGYRTYGEVVTLEPGSAEEITVRLDPVDVSAKTEGSGAKSSGSAATGASPPPAVEKDIITSTACGMRLKLIPAGEFEMGSSKDQDGEARDHELPRHRVRITRPFYLGVNEVTQGQYHTVMGKRPSHTQGSDDLPVDQVSWLDAIAFCNKLSARDKLDPYYGTNRQPVTIAGGTGYRLPTEAEWEYACRAGTTTRYSFGDDGGRLGEFGWYGPNSGGRTQPVGEKPANAFGLYDMHGNVFEWCWDAFDPAYYAQSPPDDPKGPMAAQNRVHRGGGFTHGPESARSADRAPGLPGFRNLALGFRVARDQRP